MDPRRTDSLARSIESQVQPSLADGLTLSLWGIDSLVISPIALHVNPDGDVYYITTHRQKNSEFDIRAHSDWDIASIKLQTVEDRRHFLRTELAPEISQRNTWLKDINGDSSHDWRDLQVEKEYVYRLRDLDGDGRADHSQQVVSDFHDEVTDVAGGIYVDGKDMYLAVAPDLWKLRDHNGDGIADEKISLSHGYGVHIGFSGHGMSGIEMGPDGRLYWQIGDIGFNGTDQQGRKWEYPNSGVIARSNPDGSDFEIFAHGLRNTHEFVFDELGNLISEDNDGDHPGERERLVYIVRGADAGWRSNWQYGKYSDPKNNSYKVWMDEKMYLPRFEGQAAYITPCINNFVSGPSGMAYNPGTALGPEYRNSFFIAEFVGSPANSGIHSFKLVPSGAGFSLGEHQKILGGILPTGLEFGPDGALYVGDWIDGWATHDYGRIWKLDHRQGAADAVRKETAALLRGSFEKMTPQELGKLLSHADMRVRQKAQFELVARNNSEIFKNTLAADSVLLARVHAVWGICQLARKDDRYAALLSPYLRDSDPEIRAQTARWLGDIRYKAAAADIVSLLEDPNARVRFFAAEALGRMAYAQAIQPIISMLRRNNDEDAYLRHAGTLALAEMGNPQPLLDLADDTSRALRIAAVVSLRRMQHAGISSFLKDSDEFVVTEAARAIHDDLSIPDALPALATLLNSTPFSNEALIRRTISACLRTADAASLDNLIRYANRKDAPATLRAEAIAALSTWADPSEVDRVDGRYRGRFIRDIKPVQAQTTKPMIALLSSPESQVRTAAVKAIALLYLREAAPHLLTLLQQDRDETVRTEALNSLQMLNTPELAAAIRAALEDPEKSVRSNALSLVNQLDISNDLKAGLLSKVISTKTIEEKQSALMALAKLPPPVIEPTLSQLLNEMRMNRLPAGIYLELGDAIDSSGLTQLQQRYASLRSALTESQLLSAYAGAMEGGNIARGRRIFMRNQKAMCTKCHSLDDRGGIAGPRLNGIGNRLNPRQLLEALIDPGARLAPGFGIVTLQLSNGTSITGTLVQENSRSITLRPGTDPPQTILKSAVQHRENAPSAMPDMKEILTHKEIRDLVSFLSSMKSDQ